MSNGAAAGPCTHAMYDGCMKRSGVADLPLHGGRVPAWLATVRNMRKSSAVNVDTSPSLLVTTIAAWALYPGLNLKQAATWKSRPRNLPRVAAFAGDSTITSERAIRDQ